MISILLAWLALAWLGQWKILGILLLIELLVLTPFQILINFARTGKAWG